MEGLTQVKMAEGIEAKGQFDNYGEMKGYAKMMEIIKTKYLQHVQFVQEMHAKTSRKFYRFLLFT